jgi:hypothetical protein
MMIESPNITKNHIREDCLNEKQLAALELMLLGKKSGEIADAIGVHRRTIWCWKKDERFAEELDRRRIELWSRASQRLAAMVHPALDVLEKHLGDRYEHIRFRAASAVLRLVDLKKTIAPEADD